MRTFMIEIFMWCDVSIPLIFSFAIIVHVFVCATRTAAGYNRCLQKHVFHFALGHLSPAMQIKLRVL